MRVIKRYNNRKLYDTQESKYVTLPQLAQLVKQGEEITVIDPQQNDITVPILKQVLVTLNLDKDTILGLIDLH